MRAVKCLGFERAGTRNVCIHIIMLILIYTYYVIYHLSDLLEGRIFEKHRDH